MKDLDPWKFDLAGTALIEASAGTGKTFTLTTLYLRLLVEEDLLPADILVVTYTQAATAELRERVRQRIGEAIAAGEAGEQEASEFEAPLRRLGIAARKRSGRRAGPDPLRRALQEFDEAAIFTIHGFCQRTLQQNAFESGVAFDTELIEGSDLLDQTTARDLWARGLAEEDPGFIEWLLEGEGRRWQFEPDALKRNLLKLLGADEEMPILPALAEIGEAELDLESLRASLAQGWVRWARAWQNGRDEVVPWLLEAKDLNRNKYKRATIETKWLPQLDAACTKVMARSDSDDPVRIELPSWWAKWTPGGLSTGVKKDARPLDHRCFDAFSELLDLSTRLERAYSERALAMRRRFVDRAREESRHRRDQRHQLVFDDLLSELRSALRPAAGDRLVEQLRARYRFALIDEFQDTDPVQYEIFKRVWHRDGTGRGGEPRGGLILIGDPKQAIYSFRGADLFTYLAARSDAEGAAFGLGVNWRSTPGLIHAVNALFARPKSAFGFDEIEFHPVKPRSDAPERLMTGTRSSAGMRVLFAGYDEVMSQLDVVGDRALDGEVIQTKQKARVEWPLRFGRTELMRAFARDVADLLESDTTIDGRRVEPSDIAVLCQKKKELARARQALEALGVPCVDRGESDVFETREAWELLCVLRAIVRSGDPSLLRAALATGALGWDAAALGTMADDSSDLAEISDRYAEYGRIWLQSGFMSAFESWRRSEGVTKRLLAWVDGERRLTNWLHLAELLQKVASERALSRSGLSDWLERAIADPDARANLGSDATLLRLESDSQAVSLTTLHRSKGLEYEIVYMPCLWEGVSSRGPAEESARKGVKQNPPIRCYDIELGRRILDLGGPCYADHLVRQKEESLSESLRLLYVGLTRAKRQCVLMWGAIGVGTYASTALAWLLAAPEIEAAGRRRPDATERIREWGDEGWNRAFSSLAEAAGPGAVSIEPVDMRPRDRWQRAADAYPELEFVPRSRPIPAARLTTSFSGLVRGAHRRSTTLMGPFVTGRDVDAGVEIARDTSSDEESDLSAEMDLFPRGADAGTLLHEILEKVDYSDASSWGEEVLRARALAALQDHGFSSSHQEQIVHVVRSVAMTPLRQMPAVFRLADLAAGQLRAEMEFTLAVPGQGKGEGLTPVRISKLLSEARTGSPLERYADRVARLGWREFQGYLRGFIDAVFFDGDRYFLVDYKSNHLGVRQADYMPESLLAPMLEHDYMLQYLIYTVALDRQLSRTLTGYRYETHFGGAYYLFLRGMAEDHEPGCGIFHDRPEASLIEAVSALLGTSGMERE